MKRNELEALGLEKEVIDRVMAINGSDIENAKTTLNEQIKSLTEQISDRDKQLETLRQASAGSEQMQQQIEQLQNENKRIATEYKEKLHQFKVETAVEKALAEAGSKNNVAVRALLGELGVLDKAKLDDEGNVVGLSEAIAELQTSENSSFMFNQSQASTDTSDTQTAQPNNVGVGASATGVHFTGFQSGASEPVVNAGTPDFSKMTYSEMVAYQEAHPDVKIQ